MISLLFQLILAAILVIVFCVILLVVVFIYIRVLLHPVSKIPGPPFRDPIAGDLGVHIRNGCRTLLLLSELRAKYGLIRKCHLPFGELRVVIADPVWAHYVLATNARNYKRGNLRGVEGLRNIVGDSSLILVHGARHKQLRRLANPGFRQVLLQECLVIFQQATERLFQRWDRLASAVPEAAVLTGDELHVKEGGEVRIREDLSKLTLDIIGLTGFGYDFDSFSDNSNCDELAHIFHGLLNAPKVSAFTCLPGVWNLADFLVSILPRSLVSGPLVEMKVFLDKVDSLHRQVRQLVLRRLLQQETETHIAGAANESKSLMNFILASGGEKTEEKQTEDGTEEHSRKTTRELLSDQEIHDMCMTFVLAGHETSSLALTWFLLMMCENMDCQEKCRAEINLFLGAEDDTISWNQLQQLKYLSACIQETLRLYPPAPYINRCTLGDDVIKGYRVPKGIDILVLALDMHRNPEYWSDPESFKPERFLDPESVPWHAYMPFGDGVHKCIGYQFATMEISMVAAMILRRYWFRLSPGYTFHERSHVTMNPHPEPRLLIMRI